MVEQKSIIMNNKKYLIVFLFVGLLQNFLYSQVETNNEITLRQTLMTFDLLKDENDIMNDFFSYMWTSELYYKKSVLKKKRLNIKTGVGISYFYLLDWGNFVITNNDAKDYFTNINFLVDIEMLSKNLKNKYAISFNNYFLINKEKHNEYMSQRYFITIDFIYSRNITSNLVLSIHSPVGIKSPFKGNYGLVGRPTISPYIEINGLGLGLSYIW